MNPTPITAASEPAPLLAVRGLVRRYPLPRRGWRAPRPMLTAVDGVDLTLPAGASLGVVGASGSGKSTLARLVMALERPSEGQVLFDGRDLHALPPAALRRARAGFQMVFQDPYGSLDPRRTVAQTVGEPLGLLRDEARVADARERRRRAAAALDEVGLRESDLDRYPHEFSGGQRQRIAIARALVTRPRLLVLDEPVSALDVSVQAQVLNLLNELRSRLQLAYLFIGHDLAVVGEVCDEVLVMQDGRVVERGAPEALFGAPRHPATQSLLAALPGRRATIAAPCDPPETAA